MITSLILSAALISVPLLLPNEVPTSTSTRIVCATERDLQIDLLRCDAIIQAKNIRLLEAESRIHDLERLVTAQERVNVVQNADKGNGAKPLFWLAFGGAVGLASGLVLGLVLSH